MRIVTPVTGGVSASTETTLDVLSLHNLFMRTIYRYPAIELILAIKDVKEVQYTCTTDNEVITIREIVLHDRRGNKVRLFREELYADSIRQFWFGAESYYRKERFASYNSIDQVTTNITSLYQGSMFAYKELNLKRQAHGYSWEMNMESLQETYCQNGEEIEVLTMYGSEYNTRTYSTDQDWYKLWSYHGNKVSNDRLYYHKKTARTVLTQKEFEASQLPKNAKALYKTPEGEFVILLSVIRKSPTFFDRIKYKEMHIRNIPQDEVYYSEQIQKDCVEVTHKKRIAGISERVNDEKVYRLKQKSQYEVSLRRIYDTGPWSITINATYTEIKHGTNFRRPGNVQAMRIKSIIIRSGRWNSKSIMWYDVESSIASNNYLGSTKSKFDDAQDVTLLDALQEFNADLLAITEVDISALVLKYSQLSVSELLK